MIKPSAQQIIEAAGISRTHAYDILAEREDPSLSLALQIYRSTHWKHPSIATYSEATLSELAAAHPWQQQVA